jgi:hypothetical protein
MGINEETVELLIGELQKLRTHMAGMLETSTQSTVTLERIDKTLADQQKADSVDDDVETASYTPNDSIATDQQKTLDDHNELVNKLKAKSEEDDRKADQEIADKAAMTAIRLREEQLTAQEESNEGQMQTNDYLRVLAELTQKNDDRVENTRIKRDEKGNIIEGSGAGLLERSFVRTGEGGSKIGGGIGGILTGFREMGMSLKRGKESVTGIGSRRRQKKIKNETSKINRDKSILSAEADKIDKLRMGGVSEVDLTANKLRIDKLKGSIRDRSETFGDLTATEHMYQKGRADKNFRKMSKSDKGLLIEQTKSNIANSVMSDVDSIDGMLELTKNKNESKNGSSKFSLFNKNSDGGSKSKNRTEDKKDNTRLFNTSLSSSSNPKTYGEYITGIYNELENLNSILEGGIGQKTSVTEKDSDGGIMSTMLGSLGGAIVGGIGGMLLKKGSFGAVGRLARNSKASSLRAARATKTGRTALKAKRAATAVKSGKGLLKTGLKSGVKTATKKGVAKGLGKSLLKKIPGVGLVIGLGLAASELANGNYGRALLEAGSGVASTVPGVGTGISLALDGALIADDVYGESNEGIGADIMGGATKSSNIRGAGGSKFGSAASYENNAVSTRQTVQPKTTIRSVDAANGRESMAKMELQARLNANEISKILTSTQYSEVQTKIAKVQGASVAQATFG